MKKQKSTKRALLMSALALVMCVSMLVGTTFAWFTDSVTSGSNVIKSGNLDIKVEYTLDGETWADLDGATDLFQKGLWEPGHTEVVALRIFNNGSLALKYAANMNIISETVGKTKDGKDIVLSDILTVSTLTQQANDENGFGDVALALAFMGENSVHYETTTTFKAGNVLGNDVELQPGVAHYVIIKVDMAETVGNEANHDGVHVPSIEFGINVFATQTPYEEDSFGKDYDADAIFYDKLVTTDAELMAAVQDPNVKTIAIKGDLTYDWGRVTNGATALKGITLVGYNGTDDSITFAGYGSGNSNNITNVTLKNITVYDGTTVGDNENTWNNTYLEFNTLTANNVVFKSGILLKGNSALTDCSVNSNANEYGVWIQDGNATLNNCTFTGARGVKIHEQYNTGDHVNDVETVVIDGCTFNSLTQKPGVAIDSLNTQITIKNSTFINCQAGEQGEYIYETDNTVPTLENNTVLNDAIFVSTADELAAALANGGYVVLTGNVENNNPTDSNAYGKTGYTQTKGGVLDGNGNTMTVTGANGTWDSAINTTGGTIKNITVTGAFRGIFINHNSDHSEKVILENVIIDGTTYTISCDQGNYQTLEATDCTFNGWTSYAATLGSAEFINCSFGEGNGYAYCRPYAPTAFVGCDFEAGFEMDAIAAVTFENCTIGGVALTAENLSTLVTSNFANATVK